MLLVALITIPLIFLAWQQIDSGGDVREEAAKKAKKKREEKLKQHSKDPEE